MGPLKDAVGNRCSFKNLESRAADKDKPAAELLECRERFARAADAYGRLRESRKGVAHLPGNSGRGG